MKLPKLQNGDRYVGLYVFDFGDNCGVGFTAQEVAELLDSEKYKDCKVYKIHCAYPDGRLELKGVQPQTFQLETGMFFYSNALDAARKNFKELTNLAVRCAPPCRAKVHLSQYAEDKSAIRLADKFVTALIYPAEYDDEVSRWLLDGEYKTAGAAEGGAAAVQRYYDAKPQILDRLQLFAKSELVSRTGEELLAAAKLAVQR